MPDPDVKMLLGLRDILDQVGDKLHYDEQFRTAITELGPGFLADTLYGYASYIETAVNGADYNNPVDKSEIGDIMELDEFLTACATGFFVNGDGVGYPVKDGLSSADEIGPASLAMIPQDATHIIWYNK